ncbi:tRNA (adenosine(37)-N6)-dimethylallyltransferase MiaA, partial [Campylobacter sp. MIT 21-1685]|uniref:isopentenyl transferase family protein n=1 Tax=unclassified Campylobacter TaxID=2593542 RepID=UPI00224B8233
MFFEFALIGTTASGKSDIANTLANEFGACILSLDSLCVYKEINIASAKPSKTELEKLQYFGVNLLSVDEHFNVALFIEEYKKAKNYALKEKIPLIIVGGTSFYLKILQDGLSQQVPQSKKIPPNEVIYQLLQEKDPTININKNDSYRLQKWFSIYEYTKQIPSQFLKQTKQNGIIKNIITYELVLQKDLLQKRITSRTQSM